MKKKKVKNCGKRNFQGGQEIFFHSQKILD